MTYSLHLLRVDDALFCIRHSICSEEQDLTKATTPGGLSEYETAIRSGEDASLTNGMKTARGDLKSPQVAFIVLPPWNCLRHYEGGLPQAL